MRRYLRVLTIAMAIAALILIVGCEGQKTATAPPPSGGGEITKADIQKAVVAARNGEPILILNHNDSAHPANHFKVTPDVKIIETSMTSLDFVVESTCTLTIATGVQGNELFRGPLSGATAIGNDLRKYSIQLNPLTSGKVYRYKAKCGTGPSDDVGGNSPPIIIVE